jgi:hypothetical protein
MSSNDIARSIGAGIIADWQVAAEGLPELTSAQALGALRLTDYDWFHERFHEDFIAHRSEMVTMLSELARDCREFYSRSEWLCIIGV